MSDTVKKLIRVQIDQAGRVLTIPATRAQAAEFDKLFHEAVTDPECDAWTTNQRVAKATGARLVKTAPPRRTRPASRPRAPHRTRRSTGTAASRGDPPGDESDPDADPDPAGAAVARLLDAAPPFSPGQRALLGRILGGAR